MRETALLIDGDQVPCSQVAEVLQRLSKDARVTERICIRNWRSTKDQAEWRAFSAEHGIRCYQRDPVATGKNAADIEIAIVAMDLYHGLGYRDFCLITGDMDFQPLVERLKRADCAVEWVRPERGARGASTSQRAAAKPAESTRRASRPPATKSAAAGRGTRPAAKPKAATPTASPTKKPVKAQPEPDVKGFAKVVRKTITEMRSSGDHERGWVSVNRLGTRLTQQKTRKDDFGFPKRRSLREALEECGFNVEQTETGAYRATMK